MCVYVQVGWSPTVSAVVWQRMLRILGDINKIPDPSMHYEAFQTLLCVWKHLLEVRERGRGNWKGKINGREGDKVPRGGPYFLHTTMLLRDCDMKEKTRKSVCLPVHGTLIPIIHLGNCLLDMVLFCHTVAIPFFVRYGQFSR